MIALQRLYAGCAICQWMSLRISSLLKVLFTSVFNVAVESPMEI